MKPTLEAYKNIFFIGIAGTGMSAIAQYLSGIGKSVSGSDRYFDTGTADDTRGKLSAAGIACFSQDGSGIHQNIDLVVVSTAIEDTVPEVQKTISLGIPVMKRSEVLAMIARSKKTIAVGGTSGKSTTSAMLFAILQHAGLNPGIISGAGLVELIKQGKIGNAAVGSGEWLVIEADESDGSIVQYEPETGLLLNIDKDHQDIPELMKIFDQFKKNTKQVFIVNQSNKLAASLSLSRDKDFSIDGEACGYSASGFVQNGMQSKFMVNGYPFELPAVGKHNMENAVAAIAVANQLGVSFQVCAEALKTYSGIYRRHQVLGTHNGITVIDDYAHNPVKCAASIRSCQPLAPKIVAWFQPHGYGPTRFLKDDFVNEISAALRPEDEIWMSEIFYAGGTAVKDISARDLTEAIAAKGKKAYFVENRNDFFENVKPHLENPGVLLLMGARDPSLESFAQQILNALRS
jgi:UDP-N-acetylmuramate--alanine ligase